MDKRIELTKEDKKALAIIGWELFKGFPKLIIKSFKRDK